MPDRDALDAAMDDIIIAARLYDLRGPKVVDARDAVRKAASEMGEVYRVAIADKVTNEPLVILTRGGIKMGDRVRVLRVEGGE